MRRGSPLALMSAMVAMVLASAGSAPGTGQAGVPKPRRKADTYPPRWPNEPEQKTAMQREIAEHNAAVERRKAEKKARKKGGVR